MFGVSFPELCIVFVVVLLVFGPDKLPEAARTLGKWLGDLRRGSDAVRREFYNSVYRPADEIRDFKSELRTVGRELIEPAPAEEYTNCEIEAKKRAEAEKKAAESAAAAQPPLPAPPAAPSPAKEQ